MIRLKHNFLSLSLLCLLMSCGFKPVYDSNTQIILPSIRIENIQGDQPYLLRAHLEDELNTYGNPSLAIDIKLVKKVEDALISKQNIVTRKTLVINTSYTLKDLKDNRIIKADSFRTTTSFGEVDSPFASFAGSEKAYENLIKEISRMLKARIILALQSNGYIYK